MAKALGSTVEEEHREGLHKLAKACLLIISVDYCESLLASKLANKRRSWIIFHRHRATGGPGVV